MESPSTLKAQQFPAVVSDTGEIRKFEEAWSFMALPNAPRTFTRRENGIRNPEDLRIRKFENIYFSIG